MNVKISKELGESFKNIISFCKSHKCDIECPFYDRSTKYCFFIYGRTPQDWPEVKQETIYSIDFD